MYDIKKMFGELSGTYNVICTILDDCLGFLLVGLSKLK